MMNAQYNAMADPGVLELGGRRSQRGIIFEVWRLFWCPFSYTLCFCSESREQNTHCKHCMLIIIKSIVFCSQNFKKLNPQKISNWRARARCAGAGSAFAMYNVYNISSSKHWTSQFTQTLPLHSACLWDSQSSPWELWPPYHASAGHLPKLAHAQLELDWDYLRPPSRQVVGWESRW